MTGRVRGKKAIIGDDASMTGGTLIAGAQALREHGVTEVNVFVTHALFSDEALEAIGHPDSGISRLVVTDTVPLNTLDLPKNLTVLSVSALLAEAIMNVFSDESVSGIFGGENQLF